MERLKQHDVFSLPVSDIFYDDAFNCRGSFTSQSVDDLAESIRLHDLQFPIVVQPFEQEDGYSYRLLAGHRRFRAVTWFLKWTHIPATVRYDFSEHQARILNLTENLERKALNMLEEATALNNLYPEGVSLRAASREINKPTRWVHARRKLLLLPPMIQQMAAAGIIAASNIETISGLETEDDQIQCAKEIARSKSTRGFKKRLDVQPKFQRKFQYRQTKQQISNMISHLFEVQCNGLGTRLLAWVARQVTDAEIEKDIQNATGYDPPDGYISPFAPD